MVYIFKGEGVTSPDVLLLLWLFSGNKCVVVCPVLRSLSLSLSLTVPSQVESPSPVACYQSVPVTESGVYKGSPVFAAERPTSSLLQTEHFSGLLLTL